ncbi:MAG TPA: hypothetical protein PKM63_12020 [Panacibacter sp.]|nr:hypothetical protein [Panacibacter sp.]HNP45007.1 hypothetical protein [Panacibacter sp.]
MRKRKHLAFLFLLFACRTFGQQDDYFSKEPPSNEPQMFAPGNISDEFGNRDMAISPKGDEIFYTLQARNFSAIVYCKKVNGRWGKPEVAPFSGIYNDLEPTFAADGSSIYFVSARPLDESDKQKDYDVWSVQRTKDGWAEPKNLGAPVNSDKDEYYPSVAMNGNMYFTRAVDGREEDIMLCKFSNGSYDTAVSLPNAVNSVNDEFNAFIDPEERYIIFSVYGKKDLGRGDLYISKKDDNNNWMPAENLGAAINSDGLDYCPYVSPDNKYFFFTSNRSDNKAPFAKQQSMHSLSEMLHSPLNGYDNIYWIKATVITGK